MLVGGIRARGETPFLHALASNTSALIRRPTRVRPLRWTSLPVPGRAEETIREMGAIVQAIEAKDADAAAAACATHVRNAAATALARMAESAEPLGQAR